MNRRQLLRQAGLLAIGLSLVGCGSRDRDRLRVELLKSSLPAQLLQEFERSQTQPVQLMLEASETLQALFQTLGQWYPLPQRAASGGGWGQFLARAPWQGQPQPAAVMTLGDYWLTAAIQRDYLTPIPVDNLAGWATLPRSVQAVGTRDRIGQRMSDPTQGAVWGVPYRCGYLAIAYRRSQIKTWDWVPTTWSDLWRPEVRNRLVLPDHPSLVLGIVLKSLGASANPVTSATGLAGQGDDGAITTADLTAHAQALAQQVKLYSSTTYLEPLLTGDVAIAVGWSTDILPVMAQNPDVEAIVPTPGTILSADLWVRPRTLTPAPAPPPSSQAAGVNSVTPPPPLTPAVQQWIEFYWQRDVAIQVSNLTSGTSPILWQGDRGDLPNALQTNPLRLPDPAIVAASEFLNPLSPVLANQLWMLWDALRQTPAEPS